MWTTRGSSCFNAVGEGQQRGHQDGDTIWKVSPLHWQSGSIRIRLEEGGLYLITLGLTLSWHIRVSTRLFSIESFSIAAINCLHPYCSPAHSRSSFSRLFQGDPLLLQHRDHRMSIRSEKSIIDDVFSCTACRLLGRTRVVRRTSREAKLGAASSDWLLSAPSVKHTLAPACKLYNIVQ